MTAMQETTDRLSQDTLSQAYPTFNLRRFHAVLKIRGASVEKIARDAQVTSRHVWFVLSHVRKPSARLLGIIRAAIGESGWAFSTGQTDALRDEGGRDAAA